MRLALSIPEFKVSDVGRLGERLREVAQAAEQSGFVSLAPMDHLFQIPLEGPPEDPMLESYTLLGFLAGATRTIRLGTMVTGVVYRHPGLLAKILTTLDVVSGGRAFCGIGAAWNERESPQHRNSVSTAARTVRAPRGDAADPAADVDR